MTLVATFEYDAIDNPQAKGLKGPHTSNYSGSYFVKKNISILIFCLFAVMPVMASKAQFSDESKLVNLRNFKLSKVELNKTEKLSFSEGRSWKYRIVLTRPLDNFLSLKATFYHVSRDSLNDSWEKKVVVPLTIGYLEGQLRDSQADFILNINADKYTIEGNGMKIAVDFKQRKRLPTEDVIFLEAPDSVNDEYVLLGIPFDQTIRQQSGHDVGRLRNLLKEYICVEFELLSKKLNIIPSELDVNNSWEDFSSDAIDRFLKDDKKVFLSVEADWCGQSINNRDALKNAKAIEKLKNESIVLMHADITSQKDSNSVRDFLKGEGLIMKAPLYILFKPNGVKVILPTEKPLDALFDELSITN